MKKEYPWQDQMWADTRSLLSRVKQLEEHHALEERRKQEECLGKHQDRDEGGQTAEAGDCNCAVDAARREGQKQAGQDQIADWGTLEKPEGWYIAGPMSGYADHNFPMFNLVAAKLRARNARVINPAELNVEKPGYSIAMRRDISAMLTCNRIMLLPGWERSKGARVEFDLAVILEMHIDYWERACSRY